MSSPKSSDFPLLLEVFRKGLVIGLVSKAEITAWADTIIINEDEPDYFFIELSIGKDVNELIEIINAHVGLVEDAVCIRVLFGLIYKKRIDDEGMTIETVVRLLETLQSSKGLTSFENNKIYSFEDCRFYYIPNFDELEIDITNFLALYKEFNIHNYGQWPEINSRVEEALKEAEVQQEIAMEPLRKEWAKAAAKRRLKAKIPWAILMLIGLAILISDIFVLANGTIHPTRMWYLNIWGCYFIGRTGYRLWKKRRRAW